MEKIILDVDTGVDDFVSILLAAKHKERFEILGITTVFGNCNVDNATINTIKALDMANHDCSIVYKGAKSPLSKKKTNAGTDVYGENGLGGICYPRIKVKENKMNAVDFLISTVNKNIDNITIICSGPLTNIAKAIEKDCSFVKKVSRIIIMGGSIGKGNVTKYAECNFYKDAIAAKIVFSAGFKNIIMVGLDVAKKNVINEDGERKLLDLKNGLANFLYKITRLAAINDAEYGGAVLYDPTTICYLIDHNVLKLKNAYVRIVDSGENEGESIVEFSKEKFNCKVAVDIDIKKTQSIIFDSLFSEDENEQYAK